MPRIEQQVSIDAPVETVYAIARDVESFPEIMEDLQSITVLERSEDGNRTVTEWVGLVRQFKMKLKWQQEDVWDPVRFRDEFKVIKGDVDHHGYWQFSQAGSQTTFESVVDYSVNVPLIGPMVTALIRKLIESNLASQLQAIKDKAEATAR